jgi:hypothetical protein
VGGGNSSHSFSKLIKHSSSSARLEYLLWEQEVVGSNPTYYTQKIKHKMILVQEAKDFREYLRVISCKVDQVETLIKEGFDKIKIDTEKEFPDKRVDIYGSIENVTYIESRDEVCIFITYHVWLISLSQ